MYYDRIMTCVQCGHNQYDTSDRCLRCNGELKPADEETTQRLRNEAIQAQDQAALNGMQKVLEDIRVGKFKENPNAPKCPLCKSQNIKQISIAKRAVHGYAFGLFSNTARSQWECLNCGNKF
ncbi:MAG: hypothetical protein ACI4XC_05825 [Eubacterium sp.]